LKFLTDVNASGAVTKWLNDYGYDTIGVGDRDHKMSDTEIIKWAYEEKRVIVTTDKDFEEIIWLGGKEHAGVIRLENVPRNERILLLKETLEKYSDDLRNGAIVIATRNKFRVRKAKPTGTRNT